ncbi:E3 ubiquitin-protein ligase RNF19A [Willisornis vidua]|uniref:RBR-type E3 ubiquitin transferase n=1 Tax=Willisornis vidua TaxID=1566151 RepID=A0ABQ9D144_9PASS|nr:E3 ubiquitin-protein ligase RNF19A [Willisornis vidua]
MGSDRDLQSSASSVSLPSVKKAPKKRRISLGSLFRRKKDTKRKSRDLNGGVDGIASIESIHSEMCTDKNSIFSTCTSSDNGTTSSSKPSGDFMECPLCLLRHSKDRFPEIMTCHHRSCVDCLRQYLRIEISESRVNISCPECSERFNPHDIRLILNDDILMEKYEEFMLRRWLVADPDCSSHDQSERAVLTENSERGSSASEPHGIAFSLKYIVFQSGMELRYAVIAFGCASCPKLTCGREGCGTEFCYHCKQIWHPNQTCDAARQERAQSLRLRTIRSSSISYSQESGAAGCTFWGKKPWSRKKKILWQLGTLVGAPVGIALIAGIAIPAMIIGIPVYVGRKIHNRYEGKDISKHKRNLAIAGGVTLSVIVSPVVAAVTVGIGVPIMLAYVYGVVPISLCRSGGCGVSAGNGKGVRIEFDDENDINVGGTNAAVDTTSVAEARHNPSIGEGSVGGLTGSLSASGSHMDRIGAIRDNLSETASTMALAGASITGSLSGSAMVNCFNRLEVQADVQKERYSLSGESGTVSLGTVSDNASTKAMAGSILNSYIPLDREGTSLEVQVDIESKPAKFRHHSGSSSVEDGSAAGRGAAGCSASGPQEGKPSASKWAKDTTAGKKCKGKLRKKSSMKINETREDMDAQLLEQQSTNSSEFDSPSLSDSIPSVADSHSSHFSEFSCSDMESMKTSCSHGSSDYHTRFTTVSVLPEVENDRLENSPQPSGIPVPVPIAPSTDVPQLSYIAEESINNGSSTDADLSVGEALKETNNNHSQHAVELSTAIQTEI